MIVKPQWLEMQLYQGMKITQFPESFSRHREKNRVVFAEAGKDFVDVLLSFLTLPLGTIARLVAKEYNLQLVKFGSLNTLYESVSHLEENFLRIQKFKKMLYYNQGTLWKIIAKN